MSIYKKCVVNLLCEFDYLIVRLCTDTGYKNHWAKFYFSNFTVWFVDFFKLYDKIIIKDVYDCDSN